MSSSAITAVVAAADAVTVAETVEKAPRKFPPPCWTQEETLALIDAYRERWYTLRRGYLRTADWDTVAEEVASGCPGASPAKTSAQCRHKMEKLRQRYRAEKQRALSFPHPGGRYFSSWFFFENMEAMENGTTPPTSFQKLENSTDGSRLKSFLDQNILKLKLKATNNSDPDPDLRSDNNVVKSKRFNSTIKIPMEYSSPYLGTEIAHRDEEENLPEENPINFAQIQKPPQRSKSKKSSKNLDDFNTNGEFHHEILPPGLRMKKTPSNSNEEFWLKFSNNINNSSGSPAFGSKPWASLNSNPDPRSAMNGLKRSRNPLDEIVGSIKLLGEGFVKVEKAKMEMAREMEAMRMEMEMKRNQMLLESQKQIVDAFLKGLFEINNKNKKVKTEIAAAESAES